MSCTFSDTFCSNQLKYSKKLKMDSPPQAFLRSFKRTLEIDNKVLEIVNTLS